LRIGIDAHHLEGERTGVGRYLLNILRFFPEYAKKADHFFLYFKDAIPDLSELQNSHYTVRLLDPVLGKRSTALFTHVALPKQATRDDVDVLWCPGYIGPFRFGGKIAVTLHDIIFEARPDLYTWPSFADRIFLKWVAKKTAARSAHIFVPSEFTKKEVMRLYHIPEQRITVTALGVDRIFYTLPQEALVRNTKAHYGIGGRYFLFYGSIFNRRNIPECLEAFVQVAKEVPDLEFLLGGRDYTHSANQLQKRIAEYNEILGRKAIHWVSHIPSRDLPLLIRGAAALVWVSDYEGFGLPVVEAFAAGAPVICAKTSSLTEIAGGCALYIEDTQNKREIARAMKRMLTDTQFQQALCSCGRERAKQFDWEKTAEKTFRTLREMIQ